MEYFFYGDRIDGFNFPYFSNQNFSLFKTTSVKDEFITLDAIKEIYANPMQSNELCKKFFKYCENGIARFDNNDGTQSLVKSGGQFMLYEPTFMAYATKRGEFNNRFKFVPCKKGFNLIEEEVTELEPIKTRYHFENEDGLMLIDQRKIKNSINISNLLQINPLYVEQLRPEFFGPENLGVIKHTTTKFYKDYLSQNNDEISKKYVEEKLDFIKEIIDSKVKQHNEFCLTQE